MAKVKKRDVVEDEMLTIRNVNNLKESPISKDKWDKNKHKWKGVFEVVKKAPTPPEVKDLQAKKSDTTAEKLEEKTEEPIADNNSGSQNTPASENTPT